MISLPLWIKQSGANESIFLERNEEDVLFRYYERRMLDFCNAFKPAMPKSVVVGVLSLYVCNICATWMWCVCWGVSEPCQGTAIMYFRRFYLNNSIMEYHPRIIMWGRSFGWNSHVWPSQQVKALLNVHSWDELLILYRDSFYSYYRKNMPFMVMIWSKPIVFSQVDVCVPVL